MAYQTDSVNGTGGSNKRSAGRDAMGSSAGAAARQRRRSIAAIANALAKATTDLESALDRAAYEAGRLVGQGADRSKVGNNLYLACQMNGLLADIGPDAVQSIISGGIAEGVRAAEEELRDDAARTWPDTGAPRPLDWRDGLISAPDLMAKVFPDITYVVPGILPEGLNLLVGRPKLGKSWLALDLCIGVAGNGPVMTSIAPGVRGDVLYLALEDNQRRIQRRLKKLLGTAQAPERLHIHTRWRRTSDGGVDDLKAWYAEHPNAKLIVIDTLAAIRPLAGNDGYTKDYLAAAALQQLAGELGITILVLHHDRKADAEDAFDTVSGTLGLTGAADGILLLKRDPSGGMCVLHGRGRDIEDFELAVRFDKDTCIWRMLGDADQERQSKQRRRIIDVLGAADAPMGPRAIAEESGMPLPNLKVLLGKMLADGAIERPLDDKGRPVRGKYQLRTAPK